MKYFSLFKVSKKENWTVIKETNDFESKMLSANAQEKVLMCRADLSLVKRLIRINETVKEFHKKNFINLIDQQFIYNTRGSVLTNSSAIQSSHK